MLTVKMVKKWTSELTIKFLEYYENHTCLWDVHSPSYKNKNERETAYENISKLMGIDGFGTAEVKAKIRSIRNAYTLEIGKIAKSKRSGASTDDEYKPKVPWFPLANRILHQVVQIRDTQSSEIAIETQTESADANNHTQSTDANELLPFINDSTMPTQNDPSVETSVTPKKLTAKSTAPTRVYKRKRQSSTDKAVEQLQGIAKALEEKPNEDDQDEFNLFGKSIACQLKKLPETLALESIAYIQSYLVQQRLKSNIQTRTQESSATSVSSCSYDYASTPTPNSYDYHYSNSAQSYNEEERSDILSEAISTSLYDNSMDSNNY